MSNTKVHALHYYHTGKYLNRYAQWTGYAYWVEECCPTVDKSFDTSWCQIMNNAYKIGGNVIWQK